MAMAVCLAALALAGGAPAADIGANDDTGKFAVDSGSVFFGQMGAIGLKQSVMTTRFVPSDPTTIQDGEALDRAIPVAELAGLHVALAVYPYPPREIEDGTATPAGFATWLTLVAQRYPTVHQYVLMNEPNQPAFLRPQFGPTGKIVSAARAGAFLAAGYDALKAVDPKIEVIGLGLSPRGNDQPTATSNVSTSPVRFLAALGAWYRASGRSLPLMDGLSFHPYPDQAIDPLERGYHWPKAGFANLDRIKQAMWDAFRRDAAADHRERTEALSRRGGLAGRHVDADRYTGTENVQVTNDATQARVYSELVHDAACDPQIAEVNIFGFYDDGPRDSGFQAALNHVDGTPRASAAAVQAAIADSANGCGGSSSWWVPAKRVIGAVAPVWAVDPTRQTIRFQAAADEGADRRRVPRPGRPRRRRHGRPDGPADGDEPWLQGRQGDAAASGLVHDPAGAPAAAGDGCRAGRRRDEHQALQHVLAHRALSTAGRPRRRSAGADAEAHEGSPRASQARRSSGTTRCSATWCDDCRAGSRTVIATTLGLAEPLSSA